MASSHVSHGLLTMSADTHASLRVHYVCTLVCMVAMTPFLKTPTSILFERASCL